MSEMNAQEQAKFVEEIAQTMFDAYNSTEPNPWKTFDGRDVPRWPALGEQVQTKWRAAARAAIEATSEDG